MKQNNYEEWLDRFFAGRATPEEISILMSRGMIDEEDQLYAEALTSERQKKLDWEYDDFMKTQEGAKEMILSMRWNWRRKLIAAAAIILIMSITYYYWPQNIIDKIGAVIPSNKIETAVQNNIESFDTTKTILTSKQSSQEIKQPKIVSHSSDQKLQHLLPDFKEKISSNGDSFLVIVNGKRITNEAEAISITNESLAIISKNLFTTIEDLKPVSYIKIKL